MGFTDICLTPKPGSDEAVRMPPSVLKVYRSSIPGFTSVVLKDAVFDNYQAGTRLTTSQVRELRDVLDAILLSC